MRAQWQNARSIGKRLVIRAEIELVSPSLIGSGDSDNLLDIPISRDPLTRNALLPGTSLAGAMRAYLCKCGKSQQADKLFGVIDDNVSYESIVIVDDAIGDFPMMEVRDGVKIDYGTRTAEDKKKYDFELMPAGMLFNPFIEMILPPQNSSEILLETLTLALKGIEKGEIYLGKRKHRGFGECSVKSWKVWEFQWDTDGMIKWLQFNIESSKADKEGKHIDELLLNRKISFQSDDERCLLMAKFNLRDSMIIRSETEPIGNYSPDKGHLMSRKRGKIVPIISGTSLAGALRSRASRICNTLGKDLELIDQLFGCSGEGENHDKPKGSRIWVKESVIEHPEQPLEYVQTRVMIDRFTGGASTSHLFSEQPIFGDEKTSVTLQIEIDNATDMDVGLLLLLLKDFWLCDLSVGGENSICRGFLYGENAEIRYDARNWVLQQKSDQNKIAVIGAPVGDLEKCVDSFIGKV